MVRTTSDKEISRTFQGFFRDKFQFSRTKIYLINRHQPPLITLLGKTRHGVIYLLLRRSLIRLFYTTFRNKTGYDFTSSSLSAHCLTINSTRLCPPSSSRYRWCAMAVMHCANMCRTYRKI